MTVLTRSAAVAAALLALGPLVHRTPAAAQQNPGYFIPARVAAGRHSNRFRPGRVRVS